MTGKKERGGGGAGGRHFRIFAAIRDVDHTAYLPRVSAGSYSRKQRQLQIKYALTYPFTYMANKIGDFYKKG